ncbi:MAG TPA: hypothetical protein VGE07_07445 [Herpetosiphonaceae bacterium]
MRRNHLASLAGSLLLAGVLSGCGAVTTAQSQPERQLPTAPPAPTAAPAAPLAITAAPALPQLADLGALLVSDEFDSDLADWRNKDIVSVPVSEPAVWQVRDGRVDQITGPEGYAALSPVTILKGDAGLADYTVQAMGNSQGNEMMGVVARASDKGYYALVVRHAKADGTKVFIEKYDAATETFKTLARVEEGGWNVDEWTALALTVKGDTLTGYVGGKQVIAATDATFASGQPGLYGFGIGDLSFDHFAVNAAQ